MRQRLNGYGRLALAVGVLLALLVGCEEDEAGSGSGGSVATAAARTASTPEPTPSQPGIGDRVSVGSLDLTVLGVEEYDSSVHNMFNDANVRVEIEAVNARGAADEEYNLSAFLAIQVVDSNGIAHDPGLGCAGCPDEVGNVDLVRGGRIRGYVYFEIPADRPLTELIYEPLFSTNKARISLR